MPYLRKLPSGRWQATYRDRAGHRHTLTRPTKTNARIAALDLEQQVREGRHLNPRAGRLTLGAWYGKWWAARLAERSTLAANESRLRIHVLPTWRDWPLDAITGTDVQGWVTGLSRQLAPETVRSCHGLLSAMLGAAVRDRIIPANPADQVDLPPHVTRPHRYLTRTEHDQLLDVLTEPWRTLVLAAADTGLRWGELAGLHAHRLDLLRRRLEVVEVLTEVAGRVEVKAYPKSARSRRYVPLTPRTVDALAAHLARAPSTGLVFTGQRGAALSRTRMRQRVWLPALQRAGLADPQPRFHDLRHTAASWALQGGATLPEVQAFLGHESAQTTQRYAELASDAADRIVAALTRDARVTHGAQSPATRRGAAGL